MTQPTSFPDHSPMCALFEAQLATWLEGDLDPAARAAMDAHVASCESCADVVSGIDEIVRAARTLPVLSPAHSLWSGIESRLDAPVISMASRREHSAADVAAPEPGVMAGPRMSVRVFAVAASLLVAASSAITWSVARTRYNNPLAGASASTETIANRVVDGPASPAVPAASTSSGAVRPANAVLVGSPAARPNENATNDAALVASRTIGTRARPLLRAASMNDVDLIYEREIAALRLIVQRRFTELDSGTVSILKQNLLTIDRAIEDSRRALERDPRSGLLSRELDRTLEAKLSLMRRVALL